MFNSLRKQMHPDLIWVTCAVLVGAYLRSHFLSQPMRYDEAYTFLNNVNGDLKRIFYYQVPNNHILHSILVKISTAILGDHPSVIRLPAFLAGLAAIPLSCILCRRLVKNSPGGGILSAILMAVMPFMVLYSTNGRGYTLIVCFSLLMALIGTHLLENRTMANRFLFSLTGALGMITIPTMLFAAAGIYVWLMCVFLHDRKRLYDIFIYVWVPCLVMTALLTAVFYLPAIIVSEGIGSIVANKYVKPSTWGEFADQFYPHIQETFIHFTRDIHLFFLGVAFILFIIGLHIFRKKERHAITLLLPALLGSALVILVIKHRIPFDRTWIYFVPFFLIPADCGFTWMIKKVSASVRFWIFTALCLLALVYSNLLISQNAVAKYPDTGAFPDAPVIAKKLLYIVDENDRIHTTVPGNLPIRFYTWYYKKYAGLPKKRPLSTPSMDSYYVIDCNHPPSTGLMRQYGATLVFASGNAAVYRTTD